MTCPNCGAPVADNRRFCGKCGAALAPTAPPEPPPAPASTASPKGAPPSAWGAATAYQPPQPPAAAPTAQGAGAGTGADPYAPPDMSAPPGWGAPPPQYAPPGYGGPPPAYPPPGAAPGNWQGSPYPYGPQGPPSTNGLAIASLVLGLVGWMFCGVGSVVAIVLGFVARDQIKRSWGRQTGSGMAMAGIILGFIGAAFWLFALIAQIVSSANSVS